jgi:hypothetical protein
MKSTIILTSFSGKYSVRVMTDDTFTLTSEAAKELSQLGASKGGEARAQKLSPERRREIARAAVEARWEKAGKAPIPQALYVGDLKIGNMVFPCSVLSDGSRILTQSDFMSGMDMYYSGWVARNRPVEDSSAEVPHFLSFKNLKPFVDRYLGDLQSISLRYRTSRGNIAHGIRAEIIPKICEIWLDAEEQGRLGARQKKIAAKAKILMRGLAHVGIIALVDEATGYQDDRAKDALAKILERFIAKELRPYVKTFPTDFYKEMFRLRNWKWPDLPAEQRRRPILVGNLTDNVVYDRLAPGVKQRLKELIGRDESGRLKKKMFQRLTDEVGDPKLREHLASVVALMKAADDWPGFIKMIDRALPKYKPMPLFEASEQKQP